MEPPCAVCGEKVYPDTDHTRVLVTEKRIEDRGGQTQFYLHDDCARAVTGSWRKA